MRKSLYATILGGLAAVVGFRLMWRLIGDIWSNHKVILDGGAALSPLSTVLLIFASLWMIITGLRTAILGR